MNDFKSIEHKLSDGMLHIEQMENYGDSKDNHPNNPGGLIKFIYLHSASQNRYEIMLNNNDIRNLCPLFTAYEQLHWKVFNSKPTVSLKVSTVGLQWKISISFEEEQIININLDLMTGEEHAHINRRFQMISEENQDMKKQMDDMKKQIDRLKEVVLRGLSGSMSHAANTTYNGGYNVSNCYFATPLGLAQNSIGTDPNTNYDKFKNAIFP